MKVFLFLILMLISISNVGYALESTLTEAQALEFCQQWLPHWVGGEKSVEKLLSFYTDDTIYEDPNVPQGLKGKPALGEFLKVLLKKYPDWKFEIVGIFPTSKGFILQYQGTIPVEGGKVITNFRGVDIIDLEDGKIAKQQGFYDRHVFF